MAYVKGIAENEKEHRIYHDRIVNGVPARPLKTDVILWAEHKDRIEVVNAYSSDAQRKRAALTAQTANREMHYDFGIYSQHEPPDERNIHLFLYSAQNRVVGLLILEKRKVIWRCSWETFERGEVEERSNDNYLSRTTTIKIPGQRQLFFPSNDN